MSKTYDHALRVAEQIIQRQQTPQPTPTIQFPEPLKLKETPKPLSYFYSPLKSIAINSNANATVFNFKVPPLKVFHIEQIGNNYYDDTYSNFEIDGVLIEKVERIISNINSPFSIRHKYFAAKDNVLWKTYNNSRKKIVSEVLIDGTLYNIEDWKMLIGRF